MANNSIIKFNNNTYEALTVEEIHELLLKKISDVYRVNVSDTSWTADSIYQKIQATWLRDFGLVGEATFNMLNIDAAVGNRLDQLVSILRIKRRGNTYARIKCSVDYEDLAKLGEMAGVYAFDERRNVLYQKDINGWLPIEVFTTTPPNPQTDDLRFTKADRKLSKYNGTTTTWDVIATLDEDNLFYSDEVTIPENSMLTFQDQNGRSWYLIDGTNPLQQQPLHGSVKLMDENTYSLKEYGEFDINTLGGSFLLGSITTYTTLSQSVSYLNTYNFKISNASVIQKGSEYEDDAALRSRFKSMDVTGLSSNTMMDSMKAALLDNFKFLDDVFIYANTTNDTITFKLDTVYGLQSSVTSALGNGVELPLYPHNTLVFLKVKDGNNPASESYDMLLDTIIKKLPLGIGTETSVGTETYAGWAATLNAKWKTKPHAPVPIAPTITLDYSAIVASPVSPKITIKLDTTLTNGALEQAKTRIKNHLRNYSLTFKIGQPIIVDDIRTQIYMSNINLSNPIYRADSVEISGLGNSYDVKFRYWLVKESDIEFTT